MALSQLSTLSIGMWEPLKQAGTLADNELVPGLLDIPGTSLIFTEEKHFSHIPAPVLKTFMATNAVVEPSNYAFKPVTYRMFHSRTSSPADGKMHINTLQHTTQSSPSSPQGHPLIRTIKVNQLQPASETTNQSDLTEQTERKRHPPPTQHSIMWCCCKCGTAVTGSSKCSRCGHDKCSDCDNINEGKGK